jgi:hypothetical protein
MLNLGIESLNEIDRPSPFAKELIDLFQSIIDERDKFGKIADRLKALKSQIPKFKKEVIKIINKHTGLESIGVTVSDVPRCMIAINPILKPKGTKDKNKWYKLTEKTYETAKGFPQKLTKVEMDNLTKLCENFHKTGKVDNSIKEQIYEVKYHLYYDIYFTLGIEEYGGPKFKNNTAAECATHILHEVGHALMLADKAADVYLKQYVISRRVREYMTDKDTKLSDKVSVVKKLFKQIKEAKGPISEGSKVQNMVSLVSKLLDKHISDEDNYNPTGLVAMAIDLLIICLTVVLLAIPYAIVSLISFAHGVSQPVFNVLESMNTTGKISPKQSDIITTHFDRIYTEMYADRYASKNGLYASNISGMNVLINNINHMSLTTGWRGTFVLNSFIYMQRIFETIVFSPLMIDEEHGNDVERLRRMQSFLIEEMKRNDIPEEIVLGLLKQYKESERGLKEISFISRLSYGMQNFWSIVGKLTDLLLSGFRHNQQADTYFLRSTYEALKSNKLYVSSANLLQLIKKK